MKDASISSSFEALSVPMKLATAGTAACFADFMSFPLDTAKVRLQVQGEVRISMPLVASHCVAINGSTLGIPYATVQYRGILGTLATITREEGFRAVYNGLNAGLQRQMCFASVRLGMYEPTKRFYQGLLKVKDANGGILDISARIMAGMTTGGMAVLCAQPTDVVKVRMQAQSKNAKTVYKGTWQAYKTIFIREGVPGLWRGTLPNVGRNAIVNVSEIVCYDLVKEAILRSKLMNDNILCHFSSAVVAGFCATVCASPVDVVKTRYMSSAAGKYSGAFDCALKTLQKEGAGAFYKGFWPSFSRLVSWNIVMWISYEQLKRIVVQRYHKDHDLA